MVSGKIRNDIMTLYKLGKTPLEFLNINRGNPIDKNLINLDITKFVSLTL